MKITLTRKSDNQLFNIDSDDIEEIYANNFGTTCIKLKDEVHVLRVCEDKSRIKLLIDDKVSHETND